MQSLFELAKSIAVTAPLEQHRDKSIEEMSELVGALLKHKRPEIDYTVGADRLKEVIQEAADVLLSVSVVVESLGIGKEVKEQIQYKHDRYFKRLAHKDDKSEA